MSDVFVFPKGGANPVLIDEILNGALWFILQAFIWEETPQGQDHWQFIYEEQKGLTDDDRAYLIRLRDAALEREKAG